LVPALPPSFSTLPISPEGKLYFRRQNRAINSDEVVGFLEHLLREVPGRMVRICIPPTMVVR
jgi:hypothetical protein